MPALGTAVAYITIDDKKLPEYKIEKDDSGEAISCHIPSEAGKRFAIRFKDCRERAHNTFPTGYIKLDGQPVGACTPLRARQVGKKYGTSINGTWTNFCFADVKLSEDDECGSYPENIGVIEVTIALTRKELVPKPGSKRDPFSLSISDPLQEAAKLAEKRMRLTVFRDATVPETAKKLSSHRIVLQGSSSSADNAHGQDPGSTSRDPFAETDQCFIPRPKPGRKAKYRKCRGTVYTFHFHYASRERLIGQGIILPEQEVRRRGARLPTVKKEEEEEEDSDILEEEDKSDSDAEEKGEEEPEEEPDYDSDGLEIIKHTKPNPQTPPPAREGVRKGPRKRGATDSGVKKEEPTDLETTPPPSKKARLQDMAPIISSKSTEPGTEYHGSNSSTGLATPEEFPDLTDSHLD